MNKIVAPDQSKSQGDLFLRELTHRVNNEFAAAIGMVSIFASRAADPEAKLLLSAVADRLHGYAEVHQSLSMPSHNEPIDAAAHLQRLCHSVSRSKLDLKDIELELIVRPLLMGAEMCWRFEMIVSELITNSARHAFDEAGGSIRVELQPVGHFVRCIVADNGRSVAPYRPGYGSSIIQAMVESLDGTLEQNFGSQGSVTVLTFPMESARQPAKSICRLTGKAAIVSSADTEHPF